MSQTVDLKVEYTNKLAQENEALRAQVEQLRNDRDGTKCKLAGVLDEISDFCASLDGALMANQGADELADDIERRLSHYEIYYADYDLHPDDRAVDRFAMAMKTKLAAARAKGRGGWDDKVSCSGEHLANLLVEHLSKGNAGTFEDVANFAMMLQQRMEDPQLLSTALVLRDAEIKAQAVDALKFPTMLRKMWSGSEVQAWIKEEAKLIRQAAKDGE